MDNTSGSGSQIFADSVFSQKSNETLHAHWIEKIDVKVTYDANGGYSLIGGYDYSHLYDDVFYYEELPIPERPGHRFLGWFSSPSGETHIVDGMRLIQDTDHTLHLLLFPPTTHLPIWSIPLGCMAVLQL